MFWPMGRKMKCKDCKFFKRRNWHNDQGGGEQFGGTCELLAEVLKMENTALFLVGYINVQDSFGCSLGQFVQEL